MVLGPHLGNWEVPGLHRGPSGDAVALYEPPHMQALEPWFAARASAPDDPGAHGRRGASHAGARAARGGITGILPDQVPPVVESGENSVFMGVPALP
jgi:KDO2-lipid IV(A) lauroyltransferase